MELKVICDHCNMEEDTKAMSGEIISCRYCKKSFKVTKKNTIDVIFSTSNASGKQP